VAAERGGREGHGGGVASGAVKTGLWKDFWVGVTERLFTSDFAAERLVDVVKGLGVKEGRGRCWDWKGEEGDFALGL
jgi:hypothetical protein